jgi:L-lactate dehydrogenase complex protein LldG
MSSQARENILKKIHNGLDRAMLPMPFPEVQGLDANTVFSDHGLSMEETFATEFIKLGGKFIFCENERQLLDEIHVLYDNMEWQQLLCAEPRLLKMFHQNKMEFVQPADPADEGADACITDCEFIVARTGSVILSSRQNLGRVASVYFPVHIIVAYAAQMVADIADGIEGMKERYGNKLPSMINLNTGPSRTADIEKTLVVGVHGPREVYCFLVLR